MGSWTWLHPWLLAGLAGAALPIIIHLIGRRRAPTLRFAAFDFLAEVNKRLARRERLRQILLLIARTLAVAALAAAVARPMPVRPAPLLASERQLVVIIDTSASMAYALDGKPLIERAKTMAREALAHLQQGDRAAVLFAGEDVRAPFSALTLDLAAVTRTIDEVGEPQGVADLGAAIDQALVLLGKGQGSTLVVIGDLAQNSFEGLRPTTLDPPPDIRLIDAAQRDELTALPNLAVEGLTTERSAEAWSERRLRVVVRNYGASPAAERPIELVVDGRITQRGFVSVPGRASAEKVLTQTFDGPGVYHGMVRLAGDGFPADDSLLFVIVVASGVDVLAVNGDPRMVPHEDELFFVERALDVVPAGDAPLRLRLVTLDEWSATQSELDLQAFQVVLLANVGTLPKVQLDDLRRFVRKGGGLMVGLGDRVRFEQANELFGDLFPHPLRDRLRAADPDAGTPPLGIGDLDWDHPILQGLGRAAEESLRASRTSIYFNLDVGAGLKARSILRFDNGAPALVERPLGEGRVMMWTTSLDVDFSDLPLRSAFPALLQRAVRYLGRAEEGVEQPLARVGATVEVPVPTGVRGLALVSPTGARREVMVDDAGQRRARFTNMSEPGIHHMELLRGVFAREERLDVAVSASLVESDFMPIRGEEVSEALGGAGGVGVEVALGRAEEGDPFEERGWATYFLLALGLFFVSESLLASRG